MSPQQSGQVFTTTHWSLVLAAGDGDATGAREALGRLCQMYWYPLYAYVRRKGHLPQDAEELTQEFFLQVLAHNWVARADRSRGRFRSFLLMAMNRFLANAWDRAHAQKRGGGKTLTLPFNAADSQCGWEPADPATPEQSFERRWALTLLDRVLTRLSAEYARQDRAELFEQLKPCLLGERSSQPYAQLAAQLGLTEGSVKVGVHRLRQAYRQVLREEIAHTVSRPEEIDEEMRHLFAVLARP